MLRTERESSFIDNRLLGDDNYYSQGHKYIHVTKTTKLSRHLYVANLKVDFDAMDGFIDIFGFDSTCNEKMLIG